MLEREETYRERFGFPRRMSSSFSAGFPAARSSAARCYHRGRGRVFYFQLGQNAAHLLSPEHSAGDLQRGPLGSAR